MISFLKKSIGIVPSIMIRLHNWLYIKVKKVSYEEYPKINGRIFLTGQGKLSLGHGVRINSNRKSNPIGGDNRTIIDLGNQGELTIGNHSGLSNVTIISHDRVTIGDYVKIGGSVKIYDTDFHHLNHKLRAVANSDIPKTTPIHIENHCFIGAHSIILKGVKLGQGAIIGAGSVVTKNVPAFEVWAGNPAKFIKKLDITEL